MFRHFSAPRTGATQRHLRVVTLLFASLVLSGCKDMPTETATMLRLWTNIAFGIAVVGGGLAFFIGVEGNDRGPTAAVIGFVGLLAGIILILLLLA